MSVPKCLSCSLFAGLSLIAASAVAEVRALEPWARLQPPSSPMSAAFLVLENTGGEADALVGASCDCSEVVELHVMQEADGKMSMRKVERFEIPAGGRFELKPGGPHLMLIRLTGALDEAKPVHLKLRFAHAPELAVEVPVRDSRPKGGS